MIPNAQQLAPSAGPQSLLRVALPLGDGWESGVTFGSGQCLEGQVIEPCPDDAPEGLSQSNEVLVFDAFEARVGLQCTALTSDAAQSAYAAATSDAIIDAQLGTALMDGTGDNPALKDTLVLYETATVLAALSCLEAHAAATLFGRQTLLHVPAGLAAHIADYVFERDGGLFTAAGSQVIVNHGYDGAAPTVFEPGEDPAEYTIYVSGSVWAAAGEQYERKVLDRELNELIVYESRPALIAHDPCGVAAAFTGVGSACTEYQPPGE